MADPAGTGMGILTRGTKDRARLASIDEDLQLTVSPGRGSVGMELELLIRLTISPRAAAL